jgi:hypothetical protein
MRVMILTKQDVKELDAINESNAHLNKKLSPGKLKSGENYLKTEILKDAENWAPWLQLLGKLKVAYVLDQELLVDWNFAKK